LGVEKIIRIKYNPKVIKKGVIIVNNDEKQAKLEFLQHFFFKSFLISFVFLIFATFACIAMNDVQMAFVNKYFSITKNEYDFIVILLLGAWKLLIFQFTLVPALVIWCMRHCCKCGCKK
jgi:hypothetical protein